MTRHSLAVATCALVLATAARAHAEPLADAQAAAARFDWATVDRLVVPLLAAPAAALSPADRGEAERLAGLAAFFAGRTTDADAHFLAYLRADPDATLDPALYPPEVLVFFEGVKTQHRAEISAQRPRPRRSLLLNLLPPAGQFQNGERARGFVIGGVLGGFLVGNIATFLVLDSWCSSTGGGGATCDGHGDHAHAATDLRVANYAFGIGAIATYAFGVYDGVRGYRARSRELAPQPFISTGQNHAFLVGLGANF